MNYRLTETYIGPNLVRLTGPCQVTGKEYSVVARPDQIAAWRAGKLIQNAMPELSTDDREFLISGTSPEGWKILFPDGEE